MDAIIAILAGRRVVLLRTMFGEVVLPLTDTVGLMHQVLRSRVPGALSLSVCPKAHDDNLMVK